MLYVKVGAIVAIIATLVTGCGSSQSGSLATGPGSYWTNERLLGAQPWADHDAFASPNPSPTAHSTLRAVRVGALFAHDSSGDHFCTASVVDSPGHDLLITAAHCIDGGTSGGYRSDIIFIPGYADGSEPFGVWEPRKLLVDPRWAKDSDPDLDVGFIVLKSRDGKNIQDVLGGDALGIGHGFTNVVRVTGYPDTSSEPVTCVNRTTQQARFQMKFACAGYPDGTSGSPWVTRFDPGTRHPAIIGVIGGYQAGGDTDSISYSSYFDSDIEHLYKEAVG